MAQTIFLTQDGLNTLKNELEQLKTVKRVEIAEKLKEAISFGDLSENSEYEDARNEQAQVELRISDIEEDLKNVELIQETEDHDKVNMGSLVTIEDIENKETETYKIVWSTESDILATPPMISNDSIVGKALLGKKKGNTVRVKTHSGAFEYKIKEIN